jgi:hypothetical protein
MTFWEKRKIMKAVNQKVAESVRSEYEKQLRYNHLLDTDSFSEVIRELFEQCPIGCSVTVTLRNGHKFEINRRIESMIPQDVDKPYF